MAKKYRVHLWLSFTPYTPSDAVQTEFAARFPRSLALSWWSLSYEVEFADLPLILNYRIYEDCRLAMEKDAGETVEGVKAFAAGSWNPMGGGQHEGSAPVYMTLASREPLWQFTVVRVVYTITAHCRIIEE